MTKISHLRKSMSQAYHSRKLSEAAKLGETLIREHRAKNPHSPGLSDDLFNLALIYDELDQLEQAAMLYIESSHHIKTGDLTALAMRSNNLAGVLARIGALEPAYLHYQQAQHIYKRHLGSDHPSYADSLYNLANIAAEVFPDIALELHEEALEIRKKNGNSKDVLHSLHSMAFIHEEMGDYKKAASYGEAALNQAYGLDYVSACSYLAMLYESLNQHEKALEMYNQVIKNADKSLHGDCLRSMATLNQAIGQTTMAEEYMLQHIKSQKEAGQLKDICFLIQLYLENDTYDKAVNILVYALNNMDTISDQNMDTLMDTLSQAKDKHQLLDAMRDANNAEKIRSILDDWQKGNAS
ncbi:MAG: tetratricopeptide repeat protein [Defluviitaleaceae bacterium]|nr:tetratricopeptide repeat protein [Defluviitaleaceae bacterium]